ncbi:hypothetical protein [Cryobacterium cheniae]|uniref:hypothetical protein n=1 Tax=Cryobacterium cheniae TaxID=1259262 RepID=UPI00141AA676|nr:hypothetical protein [Cryobacterium cheniae]
MADGENPVTPHLLHIGPSEEAGLTVDDVEDVLVAVAPIIGGAGRMPTVTEMRELP